MKSSQDQNSDEQNQNQSSASRPGTFHLASWLYEGVTGISAKIQRSDLCPSQEFWEHSAAAQKEGLLAIRALLDQLIERTDRSTNEKAEQEKRRSRRGNISIG
ncbi:MAG: hypothetical protein AAF702_08300 [Chloroflexota bacterium]